ncbi:hypothetical protein CEUSTIGMA_g4982.t1 [Chlamydomonas eustigma]|uniref:Pop1 N-terminal domain-containing protein n=1 Tax=Chlamydomonas eustigma TaxID=1157962 RepID=A0A250X388_9CHLO|nr:hypothetical protein CEUSTIGMA_g4982.t1 [Chlamydomonas eustigma]|eukprot:GAX77538.1 hypothetical protein CEUSTIGMA_g4982.t1 [Chlamydomonas eustigma]
MEIPRLIEINDFVESRAAEISFLLGLSRCADGVKFGAPSMIRHLRRRATSHNRYGRRRRPNRRLIGMAAENRPMNRAMRRRHHHAMQAFRGHVLNAASLGLMESADVKNHQTVEEEHCPTYLTTGPKPVSEPGNLKSLARTAEQGRLRTERKARKKMRTVNLKESRFLHQLSTHRWHAKRMHMAERWGASIPVKAPGRGRGSRSFLHHVRDGLVMHDASYWVCLLINCAQEKLTNMLSLISDPAAVRHQLTRPAVRSGSAECTLMMFHPGCFPHKAIAPMRVLIVSNSAHAGMKPETERLSEAMKAVMVWIHRAVAHEAFTAVREAGRACGVAGRIEVLGPRSEEALMSILTSVEPQVLIQQQPQANLCTIAEDMPGVEGAAASGQWPAAHEPNRPATNSLTSDGLAAASEALANGSSSTDYRTHTSSSRPQTISASRLWESVKEQRANNGNGHSHQWTWGASGSVLGAHMLDPRMVTPISAGGLSFSMPGLPARSKPLNPAQVTQCRRRHTNEAGSWSLEAIQALILASNSSLNQTCSTAPFTPHGSHEVALKRAAGRNSGLSFQIAKEVMTVEAEGLSPGSMICGKHYSCAFPHGSSTKEGGEAACSSASFPMLLVRRWNGSGRPGSGWSLVLPNAWVMPVWTALAFKGARPCGQLEWRWAAALMQVPCFPYDFPFTAAGASWASSVRVQDAAAASKRPAGRARKVSHAAAYIPWEEGLLRDKISYVSLSAGGGADLWLPRPRGGTVRGARGKILKGIIGLGSTSSVKSGPASPVLEPGGELLAGAEPLAAVPAPSTSDMKTQVGVDLTHMQQQQLGGKMGVGVNDKDAQRENFGALRFGVLLRLPPICVPQYSDGIEPSRQSAPQPSLPTDVVVLTDEIQPSASMAVNKEVTAKAVVGSISRVERACRKHLGRCLKGLSASGANGDVKGTHAAPHAGTAASPDVGTTAALDVGDDTSTAPAAAAANSVGKSAAAPADGAANNTDNADGAASTGVALTSAGASDQSVGDALKAVDMATGGLPACNSWGAEKTQYLMPVVVCVKGKGRCEEGAVLLIESHLLMFDQGKKEGLVQGYAVAAEKSRSEGPSHAGPFHVLGYVTSSFPPGVQHNAYPGGLALCQLTHINRLVTGRLRKQQQVELCGRLYTCCQEVWILNPDSEVPRHGLIRIPVGEGPSHEIAASLM